jgi:acyl-CoA-binding protein
MMESDLVKAFETAVAASKQLPSRPDNEALLRLYALYKQATGGDVAGDRPGGFDFVGKAKYDAWAGLKGLSKDEAMRDYVGLVDELKNG